MKKFKGLVSALLVGATLFSLTGCGNKDGLVEAMQKTNTAKSYGYKAKVDVKIDGELPPEAAGLNSIGLELDGKIAGDVSKGYKNQANIKASVMGISVDLDVMQDIAIVDNKAVVKMFLEIPEILKAQTGPMFADYDYLYMDSQAMEDLQKSMGVEEVTTSDADMKAMMEKSMNVQKSFLSFMKEYKDENGKGMIEDTGKQAVVVNGTEEELQTYKIAIDNAKLKNILKAYFNDEDRVKELQDFITTMAPEDPSVQEELNINEMIKEIDTMPNVLGNDGLVFDFVVKDGYVVQYKGNISIAAEDGTNVNLNYVMDLYDINKDIEIKVPEKTEVKALDIMELMNMFNGGLQY